jgi:SAM-dependent methyltransferase
MSFSDAQSFWDKRFDDDEYLFGREPNVFLAAQARLLRPGLRALSIADGEGRNSVWLAQQGLDVTALELSRNALAKARRLADERGVTVRFNEADVLRWDFGRNQFDIIAAIFIQFLAPAERALVFRCIADALKPGGRLILQGYTAKQVEFRTGGPPNVEHMYSDALLRDSFADLEIEHLREHEAHVAEGKGHLGWSALIELVARKP